MKSCREELWNVASSCKAINMRASVLICSEMWFAFVEPAFSNKALAYDIINSSRFATNKLLSLRILDKTLSVRALLHPPCMPYSSSVLEASVHFLRILFDFSLFSQRVHCRVSPQVMLQNETQAVNTWNEVLVVHYFLQARASHDLKHPSALHYFHIMIKGALQPYTL